jgi:DNA-binding GntR family transcriptional regulator
VNLGTRVEGTHSAYSIFNKGYYKVLGSFSAEDVDSMYIKRLDRKKEEPVHFEEELVESSLFDGLSDEQMMSKLNKLGNKQCFCNSGRKYKKCHYYIQLR